VLRSHIETAGISVAKVTNLRANAAEFKVAYDVPDAYPMRSSTGSVLRYLVAQPAHCFLDKWALT